MSDNIYSSLTKEDIIHAFDKFTDDFYKTGVESNIDKSFEAINKLLSILDKNINQCTQTIIEILSERMRHLMEIRRNDSLEERNDSLEERNDSLEDKFFNLIKKFYRQNINDEIPKTIVCNEDDIYFKDLVRDSLNIEPKFHHGENIDSDLDMFIKFLDGNNEYFMYNGIKSINFDEAFDKFITIIDIRKFLIFGNFKSLFVLFQLLRLSLNFLKYTLKSEDNLKKLKEKVIGWYDLYKLFEYLKIYATKYSEPAYQIYKYVFVILLNLMIPDDIRKWFDAKILDEIDQIQSFDDEKEKYITKKISIESHIKDGKIGNILYDFYHDIDSIPIVDGMLYNDIKYIETLLKEHVYIWFNNSTELDILYGLMLRVFHEQYNNYNLELIYQNLKPVFRDVDPKSWSTVQIDDKKYDIEFMGYYFMSFIIPRYDEEITYCRQRIVEHKGDLLLFTDKYEDMTPDIRKEYDDCIKEIKKMNEEITKIQQTMSENSIIYKIATYFQFMYICKFDYYDKNKISSNERYVFHYANEYIPLSQSTMILTTRQPYKMYLKNVQYYDVLFKKQKKSYNTQLDITGTTNINRYIVSIDYDKFECNFICNFIKFLDTNDTIYLTNDLIISFMKYGCYKSNISRETYSYNEDTNFNKTYIELLFSNLNKIKEHLANVFNMTKQAYLIFMYITSYITSYFSDDIELKRLFFNACLEEKVMSVNEIEKMQKNHNDNDDNDSDIDEDDQINYDDPDRAKKRQIQLDIGIRQIIYSSICFEILIILGKKVEASNYIKLTNVKNYINLPNALNNISSFYDYKINDKYTYTYIVINPHSGGKEQNIDYKPRHIYYERLIMLYYKNYYNISSDMSKRLIYNDLFKTDVIKVELESVNQLHVIDKAYIDPKNNIIYIPDKYLFDYISQYSRTLNITLHRNQTLSENFYKFNMNDNKTISKSNFVVNTNLLSYYDWKKETDRYVGTQNTNIFLDNEIYIIFTESKYIVKNKHDEYLFNLKYRSKESSDDIERLIKLLSYRINLDDLMIWTKSNIITHIDFIPHKLRLNFTENKIYINNEYEIIDTHFLQEQYVNTYWFLQRWIINVENGFMIKSKNTQQLYLLLFNNYTRKKKNIILRDLQFESFQKSTIQRSSKFNKYLNDRQKIRIENIKKMNTYQIIPIQDTLMIPYTINSDHLKALLKTYVMTNSLGNILDLLPQLKQISDKNIKYEGFFQNIINNVIQNMTNPFSSEEKFRNNFHIESFMMTNYETSFRIEPITSTKFDNYIKKYYLARFPNITSYYLISLINGNNDTFNIFYDALKNKYETNDILNEDFTHIKKRIMDNIYKVNPLEFYYQSIEGFFVRDDQMRLVDNIVEDICSQQIQRGGLLDKLINYDQRSMISLPNKSRIHGLIMGSGKTSMITPLVILRFIQSTLKNKSNIFIVLPEHLIENSNKILKKLEIYFHIPVSILTETRDITTREFSNRFKISKPTSNVFILSDISLKCAMINDYPTIINNFNKNVYLFDEIDTIIDSITSELNYPQTEKISLRQFDECFEIIYNILFTIFDSETREKNTELMNILNDHLSSFNKKPHFNIINTDLIKIIQEFFRHKLTTKINPTGTITQKDIDIAYNLTQFINEALPTALTFISRNNYGIDHSSDIKIIVPFSHVEKPIQNSQFSNPILILTLTIIEYIVQIRPLPNFVIDDLLDVIKEKISKSHHVKNKLSINLEKIEINIHDIVNSQFLSSKQLESLRTSNFFIKMYLKHICELEIKFESEQHNVSGIDLLMSFNFKNKSGFTGTVNIPEFHDTDDKMIIHQNEDLKKTQVSIDWVLQHSTLQVHHLIGKTLQTYIELILKSNLEAKVLIDVSGLLVGLNYQNIYEIVKKVHLNLSKFIYWNEEDKSMMIIDDIEFEWDNNSDHNTFFFYDNRHTTGIDAIIPDNSIGLALLGKNNSYRNVVQGIFRMRKLEKKGEILPKHKIIFILDSKLDLNIKTKKRICRKTVNMTELIDWFRHEQEILDQQKQKSMNLQNMRSLFKYLIRDTNIYQDEFMKRKSKNVFLIKNNFSYPTDILSFNTDNNEVEARLMEQIFNNKHKAFIYNRLKNIDQFNKKIQIVIEVKHEIQVKHELDIQQHLPFYDIPKKIKFTRERITPDTIIQYLNVSGYEKLFNQIYYSKNLAVGNEDGQYFRTPYIILTDMTNIFVIPFYEGFKILDSVKSNPNSLKLGIFDTVGNVYYSQSLSNENIITIQTLSKIIARYLNPTTYVSYSDLINILFMKPTTLNIIKNILFETDNKDLDIIGKFETCLKDYDTRSMKLYFVKLNTLIESKTICEDEINQLYIEINASHKPTMKCLIDLLICEACPEITILDLGLS